MTVQKKASFVIRNKKSGFALLAMLLITVVGLTTAASSTRAGVLYVPNRSFESPGAPSDSPYATSELDQWQKSALPSWYDPTNNNNTPWEFLMGTFTNVPFPGLFIDNCDGNNCGFIFAWPEAALFQDNNTVFGTNVTPNHLFNSKYTVGRSYKLTVGLIGGGGNMSNGVTMQLNLYYRDASNNIVPIASTTVTNNTANFPTNTHFVDYSVSVPAVSVSNAWAGQNIGIQLLSTATTNNTGGYWDVDNVRLTESIDIPNFSFESPGAPSDSPYATSELDQWQKSAQPSWYDPTNNNNTPWGFLMGTFTNVPFPGLFIDNCDGNNCAFIFAWPEAALFQDNNTVFGTNVTPNHLFNAKYIAGKAYQLTVGLIGGGGNMSNGVTMELDLYYRGASNQIVTIASATVTNNTANFPTNTHFVDYGVRIPIVKPTDPWAGQNIGIQLLSTATTNNTGGYWDLDNVRLVETVATALSIPAKTNGQFQFTLLSEPELPLNIIASTNFTTVSSNWTVLGTITNTSGATPFTDSNTNFSKRFYQARQL